MRHVLYALALAGSACAGYDFGSVADCETLCETARGCGFLPSMLGWNAEGDLDEAEADCVRRCGNSPADDPVVAEIVRCFEEAEAAPGLRWCEDEADPEFAAWSPCGTIDRCLTAAEPGHQLHSDVLLTVQLLSFADYATNFVDPSDEVADALQGVSALYPALDGVPGCAEDGVCDEGDKGDPDCEGQVCRPSSCARSLCGQEVCKTTSCIEGDCAGQDEDELPPCDTSLCRVGQLSITQVCTELGAQQISVSVREIGRVPVVQVFQDARAGTNPSCESSELVISGEMYQVKPGPVAVTAIVHGELPGQALLDLGLREPAEVSDPEALLPYCVEFVGPPVVLRSGDNTVVVPIASLEEFAAAGVDLGLRDCM